MCLSKIIGTSLSLIISTRLCYEKLIGLSLVTFCFSDKTKVAFVFWLNAETK